MPRSLRAVATIGLLLGTATGVTAAEDGLGGLQGHRRQDLIVTCTMLLVSKVTDPSDWSAKGYRQKPTRRPCLVPPPSPALPKQPSKEAVSDCVLILTDEPGRGERLSRDLSGLAPCIVLDLLDPDHRSIEPPAAMIRAVVSDASLTRSATIATLRRQLDRLKVSHPPYLCLLHEETSRTRLQANVLGATDLLRADAAQGELLKAVSRLMGAAVPAPRELQPSVAAADAVMSRIFDAARGGVSVDPGLVATGTKFVEQAVRAVGICDWLEVVWRFDDATHQHCLLVAGLAAGFARSLGLGERDCERLTQAAILHDIGKAKIPEGILNKPGVLDPEERRIMQKHPSHGHAMLVGGGFSDEMLAVVRWHHECLDGSGYPDGLKGAQIPDLVRLVSVCDVYGALIERRSYKPPMSAERAFGILDDMRGKLDSDLVRAFRPFAVLTEAKPL